ncbi:MAG: hypothetical protein E6G45_07830 [Actinobacteria bacterium]|nr:MAG: hypothetical protein E6G45_07830 [Actinomycetota bacterium]
MSPTSGVIGEAWQLYKTHWRHLIALSFVVYVAVALIGALLTAALTWLGVLIALFVSLVALFWLQAALVKAVEDVRDGRVDLSLGETFEAARPHLGSVAVAAILAGLGIVIGLLLLIVPGLVLLTWWAVIVPVVVLENRSAGESFSRSRELVRGYGWGVFGVILLVILLLFGFNLLLSLILTPLADWLQSFVSQIVSGTLTAPFIAVVLTLLYFRLRAAKEPAAEPAPTTPTP